MEHWWNYADRLIPNFSEIILSQWHCVYHKFHTDRRGFEAWAGQYEAGD